ncbi:hypothetical protein BH11VER1_BH11VER1_09890 [soil metagenome]
MTSRLIALFSFFFHLLSPIQAETVTTDVCIQGGTSAGVVAAVNEMAPYAHVLTVQLVPNKTTATGMTRGTVLKYATAGTLVRLGVRVESDAAALEPAHFVSRPKWHRPFLFAPLIMSLK